MDKKLLRSCNAREAMVLDVANQFVLTAVVSARTPSARMFSAGSAKGIRGASVLGMQVICLGVAPEMPEST